MNTTWWNRFIDFQTTLDIEVKRKIKITRYLSYFGGVCLLFFASLQLGDGNSELKWLLITCAALVLTNALGTHLHKNTLISGLLLGFILSGLMLGLVISGGYASTALYWLYPLSLLTFTLLGCRIGSCLNVLLFVSVMYLLFHEDLLLAQYRMEEKSRFLASWFLTLIFSFVGEFFRESSQRALSQINYDKQKQANADPLTDLPNRRFLDAIFIELAAIHPAEYFPLGVIAADLDHFKKVNDNYGHDVGDKVLCHVASQFRSNIRELDVVARTGGEEFLILLPKSTALKSIKIAEKLQALIETNPYQVDASTITLTVSLGVTSAQTYEELESAIKSADRMLYKAKASGRNRVMS